MEFPHDWDLFKLMGIGSGGFGPVFESGFIEILRLVINGYEENQRMCSEGSQNFHVGSPLKWLMACL